MAFFTSLWERLREGGRQGQLCRQSKCGGALCKCSPAGAISVEAVEIGAHVFITHGCRELRTLRYSVQPRNRNLKKNLEKGFRLRK